ncbi:ABC transporter permease [Paenibacillus paeoniae]|uniref:ABC transporter permease n=1 Tax=Paenibacillus paeoniae TaxID=2292705 RepID=A0A371PP95_9BACL|nr:ABC transporter permease [Paenibacillus paeoniae]REK77627.1 ABC transporter permease [Paenibacillus paeoniae]
MPLWICEMKKMHLYQKGLVYIGLFFIFSLSSMILFDKPANLDIELNASQYAFYLNQVKGAYSEESEHFFANESAKISETKVKLKEASDDFYDGNINESEYILISTPLEEILQYEKGYKIIYDQFIYIREEPEQRYFLYTNGWDGLISNDNLDFLYILLLLVLVTPVFCFEFESKMNSLNLTVKKGGRNQALYKIGLICITVVMLCLLHAGLKFGFYWLKYGLENGNYPLQSLSYFATSTKSSTLLETFLWLTACKLFGSLCLAILIMFVSVLFKKYAFTLFTCTALILLPYYGFRLESSKYFLPGPLGFMVSSGYFRGNEYVRNMVNGQMIFVFKEVSTMLWLYLFVITLCLCIGMSLAILIRSTNKWCEIRPRFRLRPLHLMLVICVFFLSACTPNTRAGESNIYNYSFRQSYENEYYHFYVEESEGNETRIVFEVKQTGDKQHFVRNPMTSLTRVEKTVFGNGSYVYYMKYNSDKSEIREQMNRLSIIEVNTDTFDEKIVFEKNLNTVKTSINLFKSNNKEMAFFHSVSGFFLDEENIYLVGHDEIRRVHQSTGKMSVIIRFSVLRHLAFDGQTIYYIDEKSQVVKYDTRTDIEEVIPDLVTQYFILTNNEIIFLNRKDKQKIYAMNVSDSTFRRITDVPVLEFYFDEQSIFYVSKDDLKQYRLDWA